MEKPSSWNATLIFIDNLILNKSASVILIDGENISIIFSDIPKRPFHVSVKWKDAIIISVTNIEKNTEKLYVNPGCFNWDNNNNEIKFTMNFYELNDICNSYTKNNPIC